MFNKLLIPKISISLLEQLSVNSGNFFFFILAARFAGPEQFGLFGLLIVSSQLILTIAIQWILLPITSKSYKFNSFDIYLQIKRKIGFLFFLIPLFIWLYSILISNNNFNLNQYILIYFLSLIMVISEVSRFFLIRLRTVKKLLISNIIKWLIGYFLLFSFLEKSEEKFMILLQIFSITLLVGLIIQSSLIFLRERNSYKFSEIKTSIKEENPLLGLGIANVFNTLTFTILFNKVDILAFGALQAFRSITNFYPFILQFLETHYSAILVKNNKTKFIKNFWLKYYTFITALFSVIIFLNSERIIEAIYGEKFVIFNKILFLQFLIISVQSCSRLLTIQLRLQEKYTAFERSAIILIFFSIVLLIIYFINSELFNYYNLIISILVISIFQLANYLKYYRYEKI